MHAALDVAPRQVFERPGVHVLPLQSGCLRNRRATGGERSPIRLRMCSGETPSLSSLSSGLRSGDIVALCQFGHDAQELRDVLA